MVARAWNLSGPSSKRRHRVRDEVVVPVGAGGRAALRGENDIAIAVGGVGQRPRAGLATLRAGRGEQEQRAACERAGNRAGVGPVLGDQILVEVACRLKSMLLLTPCRQTCAGQSRAQLTIGQYTAAREGRHPFREGAEVVLRDMRRIFRAESRFQQGKVRLRWAENRSIGRVCIAGRDGADCSWDGEIGVVESRFVLAIFVFPLVSFSSIVSGRWGVGGCGGDVVERWRPEGKAGDPREGPEIRGMKSPAKGLRPRSPPLRTARCR